MKGDDGDDEMWGGLGKNWMSGGNGDDRMISKGDAVMFGDKGDDRMWGGNGDDKMFGGRGEDRLQGNSGDDEMFGDTGDDILIGGMGINTLRGGLGKDTFTLDKYGTAVITDFRFGQDCIFLDATEIDAFVLGTDQATGFATISAEMSYLDSVRGYGTGSRTIAVLENVTLDQLQANSDHIVTSSQEWGEWRSPDWSSYWS